MKKKYLLNIGLEQGAPFLDPNLLGCPLDNVKQIVSSILGEVEDYRIGYSDSELTAIIAVNSDKNDIQMERGINKLAGMLGQQAIPIFSLSESKGRMGIHPTHPPKNPEWLKFNQDYFLIGGVKICS